MTECRCPACDSRPQRAFTEAHRFECELKHVAALPSREDRARYLRGVLIRRGEGERLRIVDALVKMAPGRIAA